jgi:hypothetical protein
LDLSSNQLSGSLPETIGLMPNLPFLNVIGNRLYGALLKIQIKEDDDDDVTRNDLLRIVDFSSNVFTGTIETLFYYPIMY